MLQKETIDVRKLERQFLAFIAMSKFKLLNIVHIKPIFTFKRYSKMQITHTQ